MGKINEEFEQAFEKTDPVKEKVHELVQLTRQMQKLKQRVDELKAFFELTATEDLKNKKRKTAVYWGNGAEKVVVSNSETVKPSSINMLKDVFGKVFPDFMKEEKNFKMTAPCKRLLAFTALGHFTEGSFEKTVESIVKNEKERSILKKKLKGKFGKDVETLKTVAGLTSEDASDWAYIISEVKNYEMLERILQSAEWLQSLPEAVKIIEEAVTVDEGIKVTVEME